MKTPTIERTDAKGIVVVILARQAGAIRTGEEPSQIPIRRGPAQACLQDAWAALFLAVRTCWEATDD